MRQVGNPAALAAVLAAMAAGPAPAGQDPVVRVPLVFVPPLAAAPQAGAAAAGAGAAGIVPALPGGDTAARIGQVVELCRDLPDQAYTVDCVAAGLAEIAAAMPSTGDHAAARAALSEAAQGLRDLARANRDPAKPRATVRRGNTASPRPLVPVQPSPAVAAAADAIVAEAQTVLLRSAPGPALAADYGRISAALDTARVLLRSS